MNKLNKINVCQIGVFSFESENSKREAKAIGGIQSYILELVQYCISSNIRTKFVGRIFDYKKKTNLQYHQIQNKLSSTNKFLFYLFLKSLFIKLSTKTIIHAHRPDHLAAFIVFKKNPSIITLHGQQAQTVNIRKGLIIRQTYKLFEKYAFKRASFLIAVDNITKEFYSSLYPEHVKKMIIIPTGVNTNIFKPESNSQKRAQLGLQPNHKVILYVGRIERPKKIRDIIEAFKIISREHKHYKLIIVGDGVQLSEIKSYVSSLKLKDSVIFLGIRKRNELPTIYSCADISVLYSSNEGSPLSVKESLACGKPVVANRVGDIPYLIKNSINGYIIKFETVQCLADTLIKCIENSKSMKNNCVLSISNYSNEKVYSKVHDLYKKLILESQ